MKPYQRILALDFETAWDRKTLGFSCQTTEQYLRDPRFKEWGCAVQYEDDLTGPPQWIRGVDLKDYFASIDWSTTAALAHNAQFDVSILAWRFGHVPCFILDTLSMARALYGVEVGNSLAKLAARFNLPPKGTALHSTEGILTELPAHVEEELAEYCKHDTALCLALYDRMRPGYPTKELRLIDMTLRMFVVPQLRLDAHILLDAITEEKQTRESLLRRMNIPEAELASNPKFAEVLRTLGVDPPMKISKTTGKETYAFAKNDAKFQALVNSDNEDVALLCEARLAVKSTLERTRAQRFLDIAKRGTLPVPLNYYAAHTGRWGGSRGSGLNLQNLKRGSFLRKAIMAPPGKVLVVGDLSQIEPRVLAWLSDYRSMLQIFSDGGDPYATFGEKMFGIPGLNAEEHPELRQSAKSALLGCGYGLGWPSFAAQLLVGFLGAPPVLYGTGFAVRMGLDAAAVERFFAQEYVQSKLAEIPHTCSFDSLVVHCAVTQQLVERYRMAASPVVAFWRLCDKFISTCLTENGKIFRHKCLEMSPRGVRLPNGMYLRYPSLVATNDQQGRPQYSYAAGDVRKKLYGGKLTENIVQAVARIVMTDGMLRIQRRYPCVLTVHDEVVALVPEDEADDAVTFVRRALVEEPSFMPGLPLGAKVMCAARYGDAK